VITVRELAQWLQDKVHGRVDLHGRWEGWKIRGALLTGPRGRQITPERLRALLTEPKETIS
jgi:hypothetical protein